MQPIVAILTAASETDLPLGASLDFSIQNHPVTNFQTRQRNTSPATVSHPNAYVPLQQSFSKESSVSGPVPCVLLLHEITLISPAIEDDRRSQGLQAHCNTLPSYIMVQFLLYAERNVF